jgi:hypothetical protein
MMCWRVSLLILSMIEASVVLLPEPVGPGDQDQTSRLAGQLATIGGQPELVERQDLERNRAEAHPRPAPRCTKMLARKRDKALYAERKVELLVLLELIFCSSVRTE